ncbi:MAG TPA: type II toxin-antitoxin system VapC family toxin [Dissulfurispiraceae bacterium]
MILYLGTSSLVKLYIQETFSDVVRRWVEEAEIVATCRVTYTEIVSALDSRFKSNEIRKSDYELLVKALSRDWEHFAVVDFDELEAGRLVKKYGLRRFDAIHLSAAKLIVREHREASLAFSSADARLCAAAAAEGLRVLEFR